MNPGEYPDIHFKLEDGRLVTVDSFVWEPSYNQVIAVEYAGETVEKTIARKRLTIENLTAGGHGGTCCNSPGQSPYPKSARSGQRFANSVDSAVPGIPAGVTALSATLSGVSKTHQCCQI